MGAEQYFVTYINMWSMFPIYLPV